MISAVGFSTTSGRGTGDVIAEVASKELPHTLVSPGYSVLHGDISFAYDLIYLMMAQSSQSEATIADRRLDDLMEKLEAIWPKVIAND